MSLPDRPTAKVTESPGTLNVTLAIPTSGEPVTLTMAVFHNEETDEWEVTLPLWPKREDLGDKDSLDCITENFVNPREADVDHWEVSESGTAIFIETFRCAYDNDYGIG